MNLKRITGTLALAIVTMVLTTACGIDVRLSEDDNIEKGYQFQAAIKVNTATAATRAVYNLETMRLAFNTGDQLFVSGTHPSAGHFAGILVWNLGNTFTGMLTTTHEYTGNAYDLLKNASKAEATLLPSNYADYGYLNMSGDGCCASLDSLALAKAFADSKAHGVEQLSYVHADNYADGFTLFAGNAILSCTITGLTPSKAYVFTTSDGDCSPSGKVVANETGEASFAVAFAPGGLRNYTIKIGDGTLYHVINTGTLNLLSGHIYNFRKQAQLTAG